MTSWPLCLAEIALYAVISGLLLAIVLDARARWKEILDEPAPEGDADPPDLDGDAGVTAVRRRPGGAAEGSEPPPRAS